MMCRHGGWWSFGLAKEQKTHVANINKKKKKNKKNKAKTKQNLFESDSEN